MFVERVEGFKGGESTVVEDSRFEKDNDDVVEGGRADVERMGDGGAAERYLDNELSGGGVELTCQVVIL